MYGGAAERKGFNMSRLQDEQRNLAPETLMMSLGYEAALSEGAIKPPLFQSSTFVFATPEDGKRFFEVAYGLRDKREDECLGLIYSRINNPNLEILEERLAVWDGADKALVFASGMAAIASTVLAFCRPGETIIYTMPGYGGTEYLFGRILPRFGITARAVAMTEDQSEFDDAILEIARECETSGSRVAMIYGETPANPTNQISDLRALSSLARRIAPSAPPLVVIDNTFLGPVWQRPLDHGVDLVIYSLTKYVGGHSDLIAGAVMGSSERMRGLAEMRTMFGTAADPHTAWLLLRSLETLKIRMAQSAANAIEVARFLETHSMVKELLFPLSSSVSEAQREIYRRQCSGAGSTMSIRVHGGEREAFEVLRTLKLFKLAVSLGGTESLASHPASMTHCDYSPVDKARFGVSDGLIRLSVGLENADDLIADLDGALSYAAAATASSANPDSESTVAI